LQFEKAKTRSKIILDNRSTSSIEQQWEEKYDHFIQNGGESLIDRFTSDFERLRRIRNEIAEEEDEINAIIACDLDQDLEEWIELMNTVNDICDDVDISDFQNVNSNSIDEEESDDESPSQNQESASQISQTQTVL
jgi:hypothetical protein